MMERKIILFLFFYCSALLLPGCTQSTWLYRINIQQGNIITSDLVHRLHKGMTKEAVCNLLGPPILLDPFNNDRWIYVYTFKPGRGKFQEADTTIYFRNNRIVNLTTRNIR
jgi:outer membrane protein assembly factor BamE